MFTYASNEFGFYLTDVSADNIAVDSNNNAKVVDLENIIIVDKTIPKGNNIMTESIAFRN